MSKKVCFTDKDDDLLRQVEKFRKDQELPSFIEAVRRLLKYGLNMDDAVKKLK